jgi:tetraacyldisaccharide 4'-kinase
VISRGYGGDAPDYPMAVTATSNPDHSGDEPLLIAQSCQCPVVIDPDRHNAAVHLLATSDCNIILSDDGMQHYRLHRDLEIIVVDGERGLGNGQCLPAGPLREPPGRLYEAQYLMVNGGRTRLAHPNCFRMELRPLGFRRLADGKALPPETPPGDGAVYAVAGIGNPARFARTLASMGLSVQLHPFPDHHQFSPEDLEFDDDRPVIITAKDAVKCGHFPLKPGKTPNIWILDVTARVEANGLNKLVTHIKQLAEQQQA